MSEVQVKGRHPKTVAFGLASELEDVGLMSTFLLPRPSSSPASANILATSPPARSSSAGGPTSTARPRSMHTMRSASATVDSRCAMIISVEAPKELLKVCCIKESVTASMFADASSSSTTGARRRSARAMHRSCLCPTEKLAPRPCTVSVSCSFKCALLRTSSCSLGLVLPKGSKFSCTVPAKRKGSCGMMANACPRRSSKGTWETSSPSSNTRPPESSTMRNKASMQVDFPEPVRPIKPVR
mmetsp:Transcript_12372/g.21957  ORF Transcript_12372/g.21957 Transcript_12372/m.21957 type:complete len:242 (+) Transcript_12372:73-798(+)